MKIYYTFEEVFGMRICMPKPIAFESITIDDPFRVETLEGDYKQGNPGDQLMRGRDGKLFICDKSIFKKTYDYTD